MENEVDAADTGHREAVERVVAAMRKHARLSLTEMADIVHLSPYHFARTFRQITGIPPGEFMISLRLERAKQLLLTTDLSASEVCFEVGYSSVGSFTSRFTQLVGLPPGMLRRLPETLCESLERADESLSPPETYAAGPGVSFRISGIGLVGALVFAGLFPGVVPQRRPEAGVILDRPGTYRIPAVPDGRYHLMAAALPYAGDPTKLLLPGDAVRVGRAERPVVVRGGRTAELDEVELRPMRTTDPPVLISLPALLAGQLARPQSSKRAR